MATRKVNRERRKNRSRTVGGFKVPDVIADEYRKLEAPDDHRPRPDHRRFFEGRAA